MQGVPENYDTLNGETNSKSRQPENRKITLKSPTIRISEDSIVTSEKDPDSPEIKQRLEILELD